MHVVRTIIASNEFILHLLCFSRKRRLSGSTYFTVTSYCILLTDLIVPVCPQDILRTYTNATDTVVM